MVPTNSPRVAGLKCIESSRPSHWYHRLHQLAYFQTYASATRRYWASCSCSQFASLASSPASSWAMIGAASRLAFASRKSARVRRASTSSTQAPFRPGCPYHFTSPKRQIADATAALNRDLPLRVYARRARSASINPLPFIRGLKIFGQIFV